MMYWTFDPLVARNAHLNLNKLGAPVEEFVENMYGATNNSPMQGNSPPTGSSPPGTLTTR